MSSKATQKLCFTPEEDDKLVEAISPHPAIYDLRHSLYKDQRAKDNVWVVVLEEAGRGWKRLEDHLSSSSFAVGLTNCIAKQSSVRGVQITQLFVPEEVRNGTNDAAILDCEYSLSPSDLTATSGLVVKWFFNNGPAPVYQWIPGKRPQDLGILKGRLRLDYRASDHESTMHRALYILSPTTELSGEYRCSVSTFTDEDFMIGKMIVIAPEKHLYLVQSRTALERVNITCRAVGVFPEPKMALFREDVITRDVVQLKAKVETIAREFHYDIEATTTLQDEFLDTPTVFYCELHIPNTSYRRRKSFTYYPGSMESLSSAVSNSAVIQYPPVPVPRLMTLFVCLLWRLTVV